MPDSYDLVSLCGKSEIHHHSNHISREDTSNLRDGSITLTLPTSKTDPYRKGIPIHLSQSSSSLCPIRALSTLFHTQPRRPDDPLFSRAFGSFSRTYIIDKVKELLLRAGLNPANFSDHSFQKGAAVSAAVRGISKENIKLLGRWKSDAVDIYINELAEEDQITKLLQLNVHLHTTLTSSSSTNTSTSTTNHTSSPNQHLSPINLTVIPPTTHSILPWPRWH